MAMKTPGAKVTRPAGNKLIWRFIAPNVHDFVWAADPELYTYHKESKGWFGVTRFYKIVPEL